MSVRETIARHNIIINALRKQPLSFLEINERLEFESEIQQYNFTIAQRTFQRVLEQIRSLYGVDIQYSNRIKAYEIVSDNNEAIKEHLLEAFDVFNALSISNTLSDIVHIAKKHSRGTECLSGFINSIKRRRIVSFSHIKYWESEYTQRTIEPYGLKEFRGRWYVAGKDRKDNRVKTFGLDRISDFEISQKCYAPSGFSITDYFENCFGIERPETSSPQEIILSFNIQQGRYIKSLPLHKSQEILIDNDEELRIRLTLFETHDLFMDILSFGENVRVIKPESLRTNVKASLKATLEQYT